MPEFSLEDAIAHLQSIEQLEIDDELLAHVKEALAALGVESDMDILIAAAGMEEFPWEGPIVFEGQTTGDNRVFAPGSITWDETTLPWPFRWQKASTQGHAGAVPVGRVDTLARREDGSIYGTGVIIPGLNEEAAEYKRLMDAGAAGGVSVDGDSAVFDVVEAADGKSQPRVTFSAMRLRSLTAVDIPAFNHARIGFDVPSITSTTALQAEAAPEESSSMEPAPMLPVSDIRTALAMKKKKAKMRHSSYGADALVAAAIPVFPSIEAFIPPKFDGPTPITITKDGRVFGHLALFNTCHLGFKGACTTPPKGSDYRYFHNGEIETAEGDLVETGKLAFNLGHADMNDSPAAASKHYTGLFDDTRNVAADVRAGEDKWGVWVAGALRPSMTDEDIRAFRAAPLSGDWRRIAGKLELVGALAVNIPGFPIPRVRALVASGETETLFTFTDNEEYEDAMEISNYERQLRLAKKEELASKLGIIPTPVVEIFVPDPEDLQNILGE